MAIKLGGGGGSASQINEVVTLNSNADTVTLSDGRVYLKGGIVESNPATYPLASTSILQSGISFSVGAQENQPNSVTWDGTHYWVIGTSADTAFKYTAAGVYTGTSFSVAGQMTVPRGITWDGTFFWVISNNNATAYKYNSAGTYQNVSWNATGTTGCMDIESDGTHFYITDAAQKKVYKYDSAGASVANYDVTAQASSPYGIVWDGTNFWTSNAASPFLVYKYNSSFVYQNASFSVDSTGTYAPGLAYDGTNIVMVGGSVASVWQFAPAVGITSVSNLGGTNYMRVA
tara:strand:- start:240 stop:1103 length:864 start_codon:yes stop_codon:yes gene_type:complete